MRTPLLAAAVLACLATAAHGAKPPPEPTIGDLQRRTLPPTQAPAAPADANRARQLYREFLDLDAGDPKLRAEALRRLGDLTLEAGDAERMDATSEAAGRLPTREAIQLYQQLLALQPPHPRTDAVLYQLARAYEAEGDLETALATLDRLVREFPGSRMIAEAQFRRGELLFSAQRWGDAEGAYGAVIGAGDASTYYEQSLYKQGWTLFKQSDIERSAEAFLDLLDRKLIAPGTPPSAVDPAALSRAERELVEDSFRALSLQFAGLDGAKSADEALERHGAVPYEPMVYDQLGRLLIGKERYTDAADTYRAFVRRRPNDDAAPGLLSQAIGAYNQGGFTALALEGKQEYVERYGFNASFWNGRDRAKHPETVAGLKTNLKDVAQYFHATAQASKSLADYQQAARWYRDYLAFFPDDPESAETNYLLAETLFESRQYGEAVREYERTAYGYPANARSAAAAYAALVAYDRQAETLPAVERDPWQRQAIESELKFATSFPAHPEAEKVELRALQQLYNLKDYARAATEADASLARHPTWGPVPLRTALSVLADSRFELAEYPAAEAAFVRLLAVMPAADAERGPVTERLAASVYKQGEARQAAGDSAGAVEDFLRVGTLAPQSPIRTTAEYDAAGLLMQSKQWERAITVYEAFRRDHPASPLVANVPRNLAIAYVEAGRPAEAAREFTLVSDAAGETPEVRRAALVEAANLYEAAKDPRQAAQAWERFVERYPTPVVDAIEAQAKLADLARGYGDAAARTRWLTALVAAERGAGAARTDRTRSLGAAAALELAEPTRAAFLAIKLTAPLQKSLSAKRTAMQTALQSYQQAVDYGVPAVTTAATFATAELYRQLAVDLLESERPKGLEGKELEQYVVLLEEQAFPFEERAIELHETNAAFAREGVYDQSVQASFATLAKLKPARYAKAEAGADPTGTGPVAVAAAQAQGGDLRAAETALQAAVEASLAAATAATAAAQAAPAPAAVDGSVTAPPPPPTADPRLLNELGIVQRRLGAFRAAEASYRAAIAADPAYAQPLLNLGVLLDLYLQQPAEALQYYERYQTIQREPDPQVARWIKELQTRLPAGPQAAQSQVDEAQIDVSQAEGSQADESQGAQGSP